MYLTLTESFAPAHLILNVRWDIDKFLPRSMTYSYVVVPRLELLRVNTERKTNFDIRLIGQKLRGQNVQTGTVIKSVIHITICYKYILHTPIPSHRCGGPENATLICLLSTGLPLSLFPFFSEPTAPRLTFRPYFVDGEDSEPGGGGNHGSWVLRALGHPCGCTWGDIGCGLLRLVGYPLPWLLMVVVLGLGLVRLKDGAGEAAVIGV